MKKIVICDFNRTIFDPNTNGMMPGALETLEKLSSRGYHLILLSQTRDESRKQLIHSLSLEQYFHEIILVPLKKDEDFKRIIARGVVLQKSFSIGDYIEQDIAYGKRNGLRTIRITGGKFGKVQPKSFHEIADFEVDTFEEVGNIIF